MFKRLLWLLVAGLAGSLAAIALIGRLGRDWEARIAVRGHSMEPTLLEGDWLLVDRDAYRLHNARIGDLVVVPDPRTGADRLIVKRVAHIDPEGYLALAGDHPAHRSTDHLVQPDQILVPPAAVVGRPWFRYWPTERFGPVR